MTKLRYGMVRTSSLSLSLSCLQHEAREEFTQKTKEEENTNRQLGTLIGLSIYKKLDNKIFSWNYKFTIINVCLLSCLLLANFFKWIIFGKLSANEVKNLKNKISYTLWEFLISYFIINDQITNLNGFLKYGGLFSCVLMLKFFHYLSIERFKHLLNIPVSLIHLRFLIGLVLINVIDILLIRLFLLEVFTFENYNVLIIIFGFEIINIFPLILNILLIFTINLIKPKFNTRHKKIIYSMEFIINLIRFGMFLSFSLIFINFFTIPLHILPSSYQSFRLLLLKTRKLINYKKKSIMFSKLKQFLKFEPDLKGLEKTGVNCCFCFEELSTSNGLVQLKCDHVFHLNCFQEWLIVSKNCPICRKSIES